MSFNVAKRPGNESTSPLKFVSPIIRKYAEQRQKRTRTNGSNDRNDQLSENNARNLKAILPFGGNAVSVEPGLIPSVNPSAPSIITTNSMPNELVEPVQEICAIARSVAPAKPPRKRSGSSSKKKTAKQSKLVESAFELLKPEQPNVVNAREQVYAENYMKRVQATFAGREDRTFKQFCGKLAELETKDGSAVKLYKEITELFSGHVDLIEDFLPFLSPEQALECGVFMDHLMATKMADFLALVETHFAKSPYQIKKIHAALEKVLSVPDIDVKQVCNTILPLMKGNAVLSDFFLDLLPSSRPPEPLSTDFEDLDEEGMSDVSEDGRAELSERLELPNLPDPYGGTNCICSCHEVDNEKFRTRAQHCTPCSIKFINGKIFIRSGKFLRRATVTFNDHDLEFHRHRLMPHPGEPRKRNRSFCLSPSKSTHHSSDDHRSDIDEDDKAKTKGRQKTSKSRGGKSGGKAVSDREKDSKRKLVDQNRTKCNLNEKNRSDSFEDSTKVSPGEKGSRNKRLKMDSSPIGDLREAGKDFSPKSCKNKPQIEFLFKDIATRSEYGESKLNSDHVMNVVSPSNVKISDRFSTTTDSGDDIPTHLEDSESQYYVLNLKEEFIDAWHDPQPTVGDTVSFISAAELVKEEVKSFSASGISPKPAFMKASDDVWKNKKQEADVPPGTVSVIPVNEYENKTMLTSSILSPKRVVSTVPLQAKVTDLAENKKSTHINANVLEDTSELLSLNSICTIAGNSTNASKFETDRCKTVEATSFVEANFRPVTFSANYAQLQETNQESPPVLSIPESGNIPSIVDPLLNAIENPSFDDNDKRIADARNVPSSSASTSVKKELLEDIPWKLEEDRVILHTLQTETCCEETFAKIGDALPSRTIEGIKKRFQELLNILCKMKIEAQE